jgi:beta-N-acetylhexosaminidase
MDQLERRVARLFCVGFDGFEMPSAVGALIDRGVGSAILFARNIASAQQAMELGAELKKRAGARPLLINVDQEGGRVMRLKEGGTAVPSMRVLGKVDDVALTREAGRILAREMRAINMDQVNAPVLDVDTNPANPVIACRSFGRTPELVSRMGVALIEGIQGEGVAACGKHFPGHGDTSQDSHFDLPRLPHAMERLERVEFPPFRAAIKAGVGAMMTAHVIYEPLDGRLPATMSETMMKGVVRDRMGFGGVVYSDDLEMKAIASHFDIAEVVSRCVRASVDVMCVCHTPELQNRAIDELVKAVERGEVTRETIDAANRRIDALAARYYRPAATGRVSDVVGCDAHRRVVDRINELAGGVTETAADPTAVMDELVKQGRA